MSVDLTIGRVSLRRYHDSLAIGRVMAAGVSRRSPRRRLTINATRVARQMELIGETYDWWSERMNPRDGARVVAPDVIAWALDVYRRVAAVPGHDPYVRRYLWSLHRALAWALREYGARAVIA